ncbi:glycoside hydrolase N-terminal domain-containing protein [Lentisphaera profundi]|uniref:Glycoside hydrolase N-terminal domain-containing protein n=1 Tax=Lentisphaera profundi TaxID=1658616 RepID=A0ABY7VXT1_9BACT|nr:glycoside hydrolase N-terminal domain-containing protein [Lentisphaera profundi]WDE98614.1 glycoside hydrolase N-terminal domain-containing protein [Lentisphaera profundi]
MKNLTCFQILSCLLFATTNMSHAQNQITLQPEQSQVGNPNNGPLGIAKGTDENHFAYWSKADSWASWKFLADEAGLYEVWSEVASIAKHSGLYLNYNDDKVMVHLKGTGSYDKFTPTKLAVIQLKQGLNTLSLNPHRNQWEALNIRALKLKRIGDIPKEIQKTFLAPSSTPAYILNSEHAANWTSGPFKGTEYKDHWRDAYPIGSGQLGGMVYGDVQEARFMLQDARHWRHQNSPKNFPDVSAQLQKVRSLQASGNFVDANQIYRQMIKDSKYKGRVGSPLAIGDLVLSTDAPDYKNYKRSLDLERSETLTQWSNEGVNYSRKAFISRVGESKDILFVKLEADKKGRLNFGVHLGLHNPKNAQGSNSKEFKPQINIDFAGHVQYTAHNAHTTSALKDFGAVARVISHDGQVVQKLDHIRIENATHALVAVKTFHSVDGKEAIDRITRDLYKLKGDYNSFITPHLLAHQGLFNSASLNLHASQSERALSNEALIAEARELKLEKALVERMWAMGRYLSIVGSRKGGLPVHLTGLWSGDYSPMWAIHLMNINMPMIHWHLMDGNLSELMLPFFDLFDRHRPASRVNAKNLYGMKGIYINPLFGNNEDGLVKVNSPHLLHMIGNNAWVAQHYWDYYTFTMDKKFLAERAVPLMEESALFYEDFLVENKDGFYDISPSNSPENSPHNAQGTRLFPNRHIDTHKNSTWEYAAIREMFTNLVEASQILNINSQQIPKWEKMISKLRPYEINAQGGVREWLTDGFYDNPAHRHLTHLYPIMPGYEINKEDTDPKLFNAFVQSSHNRLDAGLESQSAWSLLHNANVLARGGDADKAYQALKWLAASSILENLLTTHNDWRESGYTMNQAPIFQIESNMGWVSAVQEMIFTSRPGVLKLLPALPSDWSEGEIKGMRGRGAIDIDQLSWSKEGSKITLKLQSPHAQELSIILPKKISSLKLQGKIHSFADKRISINLEAGQVYSFEITL